MRGGDGGAVRSGLVTAAAVAGLLLVVVLAVWAASIGRDAVLSGDGPERMAPVTSTPTPTPTPTASPAQAQESAGDPPAVLGVLALLVVVAFWAVLVGLVVLLAAAARTRWQLRRRVPAPPDIGFEVLDQPARVEQEMARDASAQRALLEEGSPRTAIEACWHRFEVQAREAGLPREPWETSSEFTYRMLDLVGADPHAAVALGELYREARFSEHPLGEDARAAAREALDGIHLRRAGRRPAPREDEA